MKMNALKLLGAGCLITMMAACGKMNPNPSCPQLSTSEVPVAVQQSFSESYPDQQAEIWFDKDGEAVVAYFVQGDKKKFAYFSLDGTFQKTEVDKDNDGELKDEKELACDDFTVQELEELATSCTKKWLTMLDEKLDWIKAAIDKGEKDIDELIKSQNEIENWQNELTETLTLIALHELNKEKLCEILKKCWWGCDKEKDYDKEKEKGCDKGKGGKDMKGKGGKKKKNCKCEIDK